jgi:spore germination protein YaaH
MRLLISKMLIILTGSILFGQEVTVTIGYPDHESYFVYTIDQQTENAQMGGEYYLKIENTGNITLENWEMHTTWKTLNNTWGVATKTVVNQSTGEIELSGPSWDKDLDPGETIIINGEWVPSGSVDDWIDFLPRSSTFSANGQNIPILYDTSGEIANGNYTVQKVLPINQSRKTFTNQKVVAYFPLFDIENAWCSLKRYGENIDQLRVQLYSITTDGFLSAGQNTPENIDPAVEIDYWHNVIDTLGLIDFCETNNIELVPVIFNYNEDINDFDREGVYEMMSNPSKRSQHLIDIMNLIHMHPEYDGIDVDYESLQPQDRDPYATFMEDLSELVHNENKILTTAVHTKIGPGTWYGPQAQDYERIGNAVDEFMIMTYDLHWATSPTYDNPPLTAGCQSTPDWINDIAFFAVSEIIDPSKIQIGLPFYGYRWKSGFENHTVDDPGVGLVFRDAEILMQEANLDLSNISRESNGQEPYFNTIIDGEEWVCYFQDSIAIDYKLTSLYENDLIDYIGGVGIWRIGGEDDQLWNALTYKLKGQNAIIGAIDCPYITDEVAQLDHQENITFKIYPNPAEKSVTIESSQNIEKIEIRSLQGELIFEKDSTEETFFKTIEVSKYSAGSYIINIMMPSQIKRKKLIIR